MSQQSSKSAAQMFYNKLNTTTTPGRVQKPLNKNRLNTTTTPGRVQKPLTKNQLKPQVSPVGVSNKIQPFTSTRKTIPDFDSSAASDQAYNSSLLNDSLLNDDNDSNDKMKRLIENSFEKFQLEIGNLIDSKIVAHTQSLKDELEKINTNITKLEDTQKNILDQLKQYGSKENIIVPSELKRKMKILYRKLPDTEKWDLDEVFTSDINESLTDQFVSDAKVHLQQYTEEQIRKSCQTYFTNLRKEDRSKQDVARYEEINVQKKYRVRRQRLYRSRSKFVKENENELWDKVTQELMSDEEDAGNAFKVKSPPWRSTELSQLISKLDKRKEARDSDANALIPKVKRVAAESPMKRLPSKKVKKDLLKEREISEETDSNEEEEELYFNE